MGLSSDTPSSAAEVRASREHDLRQAKQAFLLALHTASPAELVALGDKLRRQILGRAVARARKPGVVSLLHVEDCEAIPHAFHALLAPREGDRFRVDYRAAGTLKGALEALSQALPDCLIVDLILPGSKPEDTIPRLREAAPGVPMVVLSALRAPEGGALPGGVTAWFEKGHVTSGDVMGAVAEAILTPTPK